jgi:hypothetical protein
VACRLGFAEPSTQAFGLGVVLGSKTLHAPLGFVRTCPVVLRCGEAGVVGRMPYPGGPTRLWAPWGLLPETIMWVLQVLRYKGMPYYRPQSAHFLR